MRDDPAARIALSSALIADLYWMSFAVRPTAGAWYRAHNSSVVAAYLDHRDLAEQENAAERFFMNVVLCRVLYAHALVAAPRLSLGWLRPLAPLLGDPRLGMTGIFLQLSRVTELSLIHGYTTGFWVAAAIFAAGAVICGTLLRSGPLRSPVPAAASARAEPVLQR